MKNIILLFLFIFCTTIIPQEGKNMSKYESIIAEIKQKFAPDKRVALFDVSTEIENEKVFLTGETNLPDAKNELLSKLTESKIVYEDRIILLPAGDLKDKVTGVINLSVANIRSKPDHAAEMLTQSLLGTVVNVFKKNGGWYYIQTPDNYLGWVDDDGVELMTKPESQQWKDSQKIIYKSVYGFAYSLPDENSQTVSDVVIGNIIEVIGDENSFYKVSFPDKRTAYIKKNEAEDFNIWVNSVTPVVENILKTAHKFMGVPYLWGGTSAKSMDCSGFTKTVYFLNGLVLQRDASQQVYTGEFVSEEVDLKKFQPCDLLFFGRKATDSTKERVTHVAIYIGDGEFIHAAGRGKINSLDPSKDNYSEYRYNSFIRAKRVLTSVGKNGIEKITQNIYYK
jgi:cell wall-associated NlpC family hydrolase